MVCGESWQEGWGSLFSVVGDDPHDDPHTHTLHTSIKKNLVRVSTRLHLFFEEKNCGFVELSCVEIVVKLDTHADQTRRCLYCSYCILLLDEM